jgi:hypothetical protein
MVQGEDSMAGPAASAGSGESAGADGATGAAGRGDDLTASPLKTPRSAAWAGIVFAVLTATAMILIRLSAPADSGQAGAWLSDQTRRQAVSVALNLVPFAGNAFLWFVGVVRDRVGQLEDRFFATVFLGSGLLFLAMLFMAAAIAGAILMAYGAHAEALRESVTFTLARVLSYGIMYSYAVKVAGVFMITTSTIAIYTGIAARWIAYLGYALALLLIFGIGVTDWTFMIFPLWVLLLSSYILIDNLRSVAASSVE